ncbi:MAG: hypothetical protein ACOX00_07470 [Peptoniphilaceae bacterium]|jgi:hypothetical protein
MNFSAKDIEGFSKAVESLKKYRRADLIDDEGKSILDKLYTDLLPEDHIIKKCLLDNTTYLIGRKGTGKSTIFLKMENELRKTKTHLPCYIDVKTTYESSQAQKVDTDYLREYIDNNYVDKYLLERTFIQNVLKTIQEELERTYNSKIEKTVARLLKTNHGVAENKIKELDKSINDNKYLKEIEIPILKESCLSINGYSEKEKVNEFNIGNGENSIQFSSETITGTHKSGNNLKAKNQKKDVTSRSENFSDIFIRVFEIKEVILKIKEILKSLGIKHLVIMLDDLSEIDDDAIITWRGYTSLDRFLMGGTI